MGIERFFSSIEQSSVTNFKSNFTNKLENKINCDCLCIDFYSIIHTVSTKIIFDLNYALYQLIKGSGGKTENKKLLDTLHKYHSLPSFSVLTADFIDKIDDFVYEVNNRMNHIVMLHVYLFVQNILENFIDSDKLKNLIIAFDGVPNKSKMLEQKKRRYTG